MKPLEEAGVEVEVVPGVSSLFASAAALKTQLTLKGVSESLIVTRPAGTTLEKDELAALSRHNTTMAIFLGIDKIRDIVDNLDRPGDTPVAVVYHASWPDERVLQGTLADIAEKVEAAGISKSALILVGERGDKNRISEVSPIQRSVAQKSVAILVFPRDREKAEKIAEALQERYSPTIILYEKDKIEMMLERYELVVAVMAVGIVVRMLCPHLMDKWTDRPVVAVDSSLSCAVPVVGGHHGANELARFLAAGLGLFAAVTTATDASGRPCLEEVATRLSATIVNKESSKAVNLAFLKEDVPVLRLKGPKIVIVDEDVAVLKTRGLVVGIGARKGVSASEVLQAIDEALKETGRRREEIAILATAWLKSEEEGMLQAAGILGKEDDLPLQGGPQFSSTQHCLPGP